MLGGLLFIFWRLAELVTLIPIVGMLVSTSGFTYASSQLANEASGVVR
jgi:hypothetical protein